MLTLLALQPLLSPDLVRLIIGVVILGVCLYLVQTYVPMAAPIKTLLTVIVVLLVVIWLLRVAGLL